MTLWTLRHPPVDRGGRCVGQGRLDILIPLDDAVAQAMATAPLRPRRLYSSDQPRCARLAAELGKRWDLQPTFDAALREMHFGDWEGQHYDDLDRDDTTRWRHWCAHWQTAAPPHGESLPAFCQRIEAWLRRHGPFSETAVVTHAGVIRALHGVSGVPWPDAMSIKVPFLGWTPHVLDDPLTR